MHRPVGRDLDERGLVRRVLVSDPALCYDMSILLHATQSRGGVFVEEVWVSNTFTVLGEFWVNFGIASR